jgi:transcriptional regulator with XRE-family HTH domain
VGIAATIRRAREAVGMSQGELARRVGFRGKSSIAHIEAARKRLYASDLLTIARILNIDLNALRDEEV